MPGAFNRQATPLARPELFQTISGTSAILGGRVQRRPNRKIILPRALNHEGEWDRTRLQRVCATDSASLP